jgi:glyoxylase-like metal-dependent hydrolase (beta-lactamase superfamily II)
VPPIDYANGGTALGWVRTIDNILKTLDFDTIIPGHGPVVKRADLERHRERLLTLQTRTRELIKQGVPKDQYLSKLKTDDLGWTIDPNAGFARTAAGPFYDEMANSSK